MGATSIILVPIGKPEESRKGACFRLLEEPSPDWRREYSHDLRKSAESASSAWNSLSLLERLHRASWRLWREHREPILPTPVGSTSLLRAYEETDHPSLSGFSNRSRH